MPETRGHHDVDECRRWIADNVRSPSATDDSLQAKIRETELAIRREQLAERRTNRAQREGELYLAVDFERCATEPTGRIKRRLLKIPNEVAQLVPPKLRRSVREETKRAVESCLLEMFRWDPIDETVLARKIGWSGHRLRIWASLISSRFMALNEL